MVGLTSKCRHRRRLRVTAEVCDEWQVAQEQRSGQGMLVLFLVLPKMRRRSSGTVVVRLALPIVSHEPAAALTHHASSSSSLQSPSKDWILLFLQLWLLLAGVHACE